ncbi:MAG: GAF domain-containing protein [Elainellaceae cyanobacterium]
MGLQKEPSSNEKQLIALGRALQALREDETVDGLVKITLDYLRAEFDYCLVWLGLYERVEHRIAGQGGFTPTGEVAFLRQRLQLNPGDLLEQVVIQQRPIGVPDLREEPRAGEWRKTAQKLNIQGTMIFPIRHRDRCFGVVMLGSALWGTSPHADEKVRLSLIFGGFAEAFYQIESEQQRQQTKRPDQPLLSLLTRLRSLPSLKQRLEAIIEETHRFVVPHRTNVYWYEPQRRYFWRRLGNLDKSPKAGEAIPDAGIAVQEMNAFYQALTADQVVSIGEAHSSLKADITGRLMHHIQARSLIAAPILFQGELKGFFAVEGIEPRIWSEEEKNYVRGAAQLIALTAPLEEMEETVQQVKLDQALTAEVSHALYSEADWQSALKRCAEQICKRLQVSRFLVLFHDKDLKKFEICFQHQPNNRRPVASPLDHLNPVDWQMIERSTEAIGIENLEDDLKLLAWRQAFLDLEVRSLVACSTAIGKPLEAVVVIAHETARSWNRTERELLRVVSQQVGLLLHQLHLQRQTDQLHKTYQAVQWGLTSMQQMHQLESVERAAMQQIAQLLQAPLAALITWQPGRTVAKVTAPIVSKQSFGIASDVPIPIYTDLLVQGALQTDSLLTVPIADIVPETRQWLNGAEIGQVLVMTLRTAPEHEATGIVLIADAADRSWTENQLSAFGTLASQLAWYRRYLSLTETLMAQRDTLEQLNWYKQRRLEEMYRILGVGVRRLNELSHQKDALSSMRFHQILRHLGSTLTSITPVLKQEQWKLKGDYETMPLASLLKRSLERLDALIKQRQLWSQVHSEANISIGGDIPKIEFVLHELLVAACYRSPAGGRLDIWCRQMDPRWLELSVTDNGVIEQRLIDELQVGRSGDLLAPSTLDQPPGLHLAICQSLMQKLGGEFNLYKLEDGRILSRLIIPIAAGLLPPGTRESGSEISSFL